MLMVRVKSPFSAAFTTWSLFSVLTMIVALGAVLPDMVIVFVAETDSSFGFSTVRKFWAFGVGDIEIWLLTERVWVFDGGSVLVI